jgi:ATP-dependent 26S proteasome regulatory subunit
MVRDVFRLAKENAPAIIFIDEVDAIATARFDAQTGADREVQRILMELLNQVRFIVVGYLLDTCGETEYLLLVKFE